MDLDITRFWQHMTPSQLCNISGSVSEHGEHAGRITWANAQRAAQQWLDPLTPDQVAELKDYFRAYGAWDDEEIEAWPELHVRAMVAQEIASSSREWGVSYLICEDEWPTEDDQRCNHLPFPVVYVQEWDKDTGIARRVYAQLTR